MFKKIKNSRGETVELKEGAALKQRMKEIGSKKKRVRDMSDSLAKGNSSLLYRSYLDSEGVTPKDAMRALGIDDIAVETVRSLYQNDNTKPLFNTIIEDGIRVGYAKEGRADKLIGKTIPIDQMTYAYYYLENPDKEELDMKLVGQGAPIPVATIKIDGKRTIQVVKRGAGVEITDEAKSMNIDMLSMHVQLRGQRMARTDEYLAIDRLMNGYYDDGFDKAPEIGIKTSGDFKLADAWYASEYMQDEYGFEPNLALMNLKTAEKWVTQKEDSGNMIFLNELKNGDIPNMIQSKPFVSNKVPDDRIILVDTEYALAEYEYKSLSVEDDRNPKTQVEGSYASKSSDYVPFDKNARMIVKLDKKRS